jgi:hypothetical protein
MLFAALINQRWCQSKLCAVRFSMADRVWTALATLDGLQAEQCLSADGVYCATARFECEDGQVEAPDGCCFNSTTEPFDSMKIEILPGGNVIGVESSLLYEQLANGFLRSCGDRRAATQKIMSAVNSRFKDVFDFVYVRVAGVARANLHCRRHQLHPLLPLLPCYWCFGSL